MCSKKKFSKKSNQFFILQQHRQPRPRWFVYFKKRLCWIVKKIPIRFVSVPFFLLLLNNFLEFEPSNDPHMCFPPNSTQLNMHFIHDCLTNNNKNVSINLNWNCQASREWERDKKNSNSRKFYGNFVDNNFFSLIPHVNQFSEHNLLNNRGQILCAWDLLDVEVIS